MSSPQSLAGKVALVTGGSKGIGRAISLQLARYGATVVINYSSSASAAEEVVREIGPKNAIAIKADAGDVKEIQRVVDATIEKCGRLDIVVACAGILLLSELDKVTEEEFDKTFNLNVKGPMFLAQVCLSLFLAPFPAIQPSPARHWMLTTPPESRPPHALRQPHNPLLHEPMRRLNHNTQLPNLRILQRRNRANDTRLVQRPRSERNHG